MMDTRTLARALSGDINGRNKVLAPGPGHSRSDRSMSVTLDPAAPDGFRVYSFAGDDFRECRDHVRKAMGLPDWTPGTSERPVAPIRPREDTEEEKRRAARRLAHVNELWEAAKHPKRTIVETYLNSRAIQLPDDVANQVLRFHPACPWTQDDGKVIEVPTMLGAMRCIYTGAIKAIHRTWLTPNGQKVDRRAYGEVRNTAVKLDPDEAVTMGLVLGEGVETCLSARQIGLRPAWALGSAGNISKFPVLPGVEAITLLSETDKTGANARALDVCSNIWFAAGRAVIIATPKFGGDVNDALQGKVA